jgi:hypothetical protein
LHDPTKGMAALVACLLTAMSHPVLPEKPVYCVKAPQRGSGKTTLVNMIVRPITRRSAVAASWSVNEEERRKAFFAVAREGHGILMIDNIPRGTVIRDATIERFATSASATGCSERAAPRQSGRRSSCSPATLCRWVATVAAEP